MRLWHPAFGGQAQQLLREASLEGQASIEAAMDLQDQEAIQLILDSYFLGTVHHHMTVANEHTVSR